MEWKDIYMHRCLQLANQGAGFTAPNPMVGAVLVYENEIIGEGFHRAYGGPHAEVNCFESVLPRHRQFICKSTLYVSLEPCSHYGKTPPCAALVIKQQVPQVVVACRDANSKVNGGGIKMMQDAGILVREGVLEKEALELNRRFFVFHQKKRPYIILKWAETADHKIAKPGPLPIAISNDLTHTWVHQWRAAEAAIMVGSKTVLTDDPYLTTRHWPGNNPLRIVVGNRVQPGKSLYVLDNTVNTWVFNNHLQCEHEKTRFIKLPESPQFIRDVLQYLHGQQVLSVLVEGGQQLLQSFIDAGLWDEARVITNTEMFLNEGIQSPELKYYKNGETADLKNDRIRIYRRL